MNASDLSVLVVDTDPHMCEIVKLILDFHGIPVCAVRGADAALKHLECHKASLIIIELYSMEMDGFRLLSQIRAGGLAPGSRVIATSVHYSDQLARETLNGGFDGYLPKPFDVSEFVPYLRRIADRGQC